MPAPRDIRWLMACAVTAACSPILAQDALSDYLEDRGLDRVLVAHLEQRIAKDTSLGSTPDTKRLSAAYARLLRASTNIEADTPWREASERLLERLEASDPATFDLRTAIGLSLFRKAEPGIEAALFGKRDRQALQQAAADLGTANVRFSTLMQYATNRVQGLTAEKDRGVQLVGDDPIDEQLAQMRDIRANAAYYKGIARFYTAVVRDALTLDSAAAARDCRRALAWLFDQNRGQLPTAYDLPPEQLASEGAARAALMVTSSFAIENDHARAGNWLERCDTVPSFPESLIEEREITRARVLAADDRWGELARHLQASPPSTRLARVVLALAAARAEEVARGSAREGISRIIDLTLAGLIREGLAAEVADVVERFDEDYADAAGFAVAYARALGTLNQVGDLDQGPFQGEARRDLERATRRLTRALEADDAEDFPGPVADATATLGEIAAAQEEWQSAAQRFTQAAQLAQDPDQRERILRLAIVRLPSDAPEAAPESRFRDRLVADYLRSFRTTPFGSLLIVTDRPLRNDADPREELDALLAIPPGDAAYTDSRVLATGILYKLLQSASLDRAARLRANFLDVSGVAIRGVRQRLRTQRLEGDDQRLISIALQALDVSLNAPNPRIPLAWSILQELDRDLVELNISPIPAQAVSLDGFRTALAIATNDQQTIDAIVQRARDKGGPGAVRQLTTVFFEADRQRRRSPDDPTLARPVADLGAEILRKLGDQRAALEENRWIAEATADAAFTLYLKDPKKSYEDLITRLDTFEEGVTPSANQLRRAATIAENRGDLPAALSHWRRLLSATDDRSPVAFEATYHTIRIQLRTDPERARQRLESHAALHPDWGPEPWGERIEALTQSPEPASRRPLEGYRR